jgi:hypothetical protein
VVIFAGFLRKTLNFTKTGFRLWGGGFVNYSQSFAVGVLKLKLQQKARDEFLQAYTCRAKT